jgi:hypothetical protein
MKYPYLGPSARSITQFFILMQAADKKEAVAKCGAVKTAPYKL